MFQGEIRDIVGRDLEMFQGEIRDVLGGDLETQGDIQRRRERFRDVLGRDKRCFREKFRDVLGKDKRCFRER